MQQLTAPMEGLTEGRMVHYVLANGEHRPAVVVRVWHATGACAGYVNLQVFTDGSNDNDADAAINGASVVWCTSVCYAAIPEPHTWHWIEKA